MKNSLLSIIGLLVSILTFSQASDVVQNSKNDLPPQLLASYYKEIPKGIAGTGINNNKLWWLDTKYDDFNCCSYQSKILCWLDHIRFGDNAESRLELEQFDYGPIQANSVTTPGHQAVVIYPKNTNWRETGIVLDPWPEQKPMIYRMEEWKKLFPHA